MTAENRAIARREVNRVLAEKKWANSKLAAEAVVDVKTVNSFLSEDGRWPQRETRSKIAQAIGWPADELDFIAEHGELSPATRDEEPSRGASDIPTELLEAVGAVTYLLQLVDPPRLAEAVRVIAVALAPYLAPETPVSATEPLSDAPTTPELRAVAQEGIIEGSGETDE